MSNSDTLKMFKDEISRKVDADTLKKLENAASKKEALAILEEASVELSDDMLAAVAGGDDGIDIDDGSDGDGGGNFCAADAGWGCDSNTCVNLRNMRP